MNGTLSSGQLPNLCLPIFMVVYFIFVNSYNYIIILMKIQMHLELEINSHIN